MAKHQDPNERDADIPGRRRLGTVCTYEAVEAMGNVTLFTATTNSRTISVVVEDWLARMGALAEDARQYPVEEYKRLCDAAKQAAKMSGPVKKLPT